MIFYPKAKYLDSSKSLLYELILGRDMHKVLIFLVFLSLIKYLKSFLPNESVVDTTLLFSIKIGLLCS